MDRMIDRIGGEKKVQELVNRFYDLIESLPQGQAIMEMHLKGHGLSHVRSAQFEFLSGFFGGRRYYHERHGHMNLREIHDHVEISRKDAEDWLSIMSMAMTDCDIAAVTQQELTSAFRRAAMMLVNAS